ncbi:hydratase [Loktanella sp. SALINAS62]|uniref:hydratase n=1 Tax=Loktanella sp. SALINAS62 TaxID=2706124 RepID=UPI001B8B1FE2|nr:hydratase [Loktanella sp. SALINAS62]MBS1301417.1 hydratase [Loktanella sp. SALINAS62]
MSRTDDIIAALVAAHRSGSRVLETGAVLSRAQIMSIQSGVSAALGPVAGFKVGADPDGGPPVIAPIQARYQERDGGVRQTTDPVGIELEIGFTLTRALPTASLPDRVQDYFRPCIVLELVGSRMTGENAARPDLKFADFQINAGMVNGPCVMHWDGADFGTLPARLASETQVVLDRPATVPGGSALANLALLVAHLGDYCGGLHVGQTVITGSLCGLPWFGPEAVVTGWIKGFGAVSINLKTANAASETG